MQVPFTVYSRVPYRLLNHGLEPHEARIGGVEQGAPGAVVDGPLPGPRPGVGPDVVGDEHVVHVGDARLVQRVVAEAEVGLRHRAVRVLEAAPGGWMGW